MIDPDVEALLRELNTDAHAHTDGTLLDHLRGTHKLLAIWGNEPDVCLAGLFHSIYGTQSYNMQSASIDDRLRIRKAIGMRAERLAFLFCVSRRAQFFDEISKEASSLFDRIHEEHIPVSQEDLRDLIEMEVANYVEFIPRTPFTEQELRAFEVRVERVSGKLTEPARQAVARVVQDKRETMSGG